MIYAKKTGEVYCNGRMVTKLLSSSIEEQRKVANRILSNFVPVSLITLEVEREFADRFFVFWLNGAEDLWISTESIEEFLMDRPWI